MVYLIQPTAGPGDGIFPSKKTVRATNRSGAARTAGDLVMFAIESAGVTVTEVDTFAPGSSDADGNNSYFNNVIAPDDTNGAFRWGIFGICDEDIADDEDGRICLWGIVNASVAAATVSGTLLVANADTEMDVAGTNGDKILGIALEAATSTLADIWFNGIHGFGYELES